MINGFEQYTEPLNKEELKIRDLVIKGLEKRVGEANAITNAQIREALRKRGYIKINGARMRKIINNIRFTHMFKYPLVASSKGYWLEPDRGRVQEYVNSLRHRGDVNYALAELFTNHIYEL